jgi:tungstate transport system substrate-binding protein
MQGLRFVLAALIGALLPANACASQRLLIQSTTSTQNSGFYEFILPVFEAETGIDVQVVAVGTGRAIRNAANGDGDLLLVHSRADEEAFVAEGNGIARYNLMYNDFVIIGPENDPAGVGDTRSIDAALSAIHTSGFRFVSRGDDSGTHKKERALWDRIPIRPEDGSYIESGSGMGATIRMTVEMQAYTMTDRATWVAFGDKRDAKIVFQGDPPLNNQYGIIVVNPDRHAHVNVSAATQFQDWILSDEGQALIGNYRVNGEQLFFPNATPAAQSN